MTVRVDRTCTEIPEDERQYGRATDSRPLAAFRTVPAYVLLGDPGSGKSTSFDAECTALGNEACLVTARDFLALDPDVHPEWRGETLFIDGLDEVRAGGGDARTPFDKLRGRLDALGRPRFRLSCREADWLGTNDRENLARVSSDAGLTVLRLDPLSDENIEQILNARSGLDARSFIAAAREKGVTGFLDNPQCLRMLADIMTRGGGWPESRLELFEQACRGMAREHNEAHNAARRALAAATTPEDDLLDAAGRLCAVLLVSGAAGCATAPDREDADYPDLNRCARDYREPCRKAVSMKLFTAVAEGRFQPVHRHVAEFLAGRHLARLIEGESRNGRRVRHGVPARRIVALIAGHDGGVVTELRGLSAWIAAHGRPARNEFLERDPIGVGLYGDIGEFSPREKRDLLASLEHVASRLVPVFRTAAAFRAIATSSMAPVFEEILGDRSRDRDHHLFARFTLNVLAQGSALPCLSDTLLATVRDETWHPDTRAAALDAFVHSCPDGREKTCRLRELLGDVHAGRIADSGDELLGILLMRLYPDDLPPSEVWNYFSIQANQERLGTYLLFWRGALSRCSDSQVAEHLDTLAARDKAELQMLDALRLEEVAVDLLARGLEAHGDRLGTLRLYDWLRVGLVSPVRDFPKAGDAAGRIRHWLEQHPEIQKAIFAQCIDRCAESNEERLAVCAIEGRRRLYGATLPADFGFWCLDQAVATTDPRVGRCYLQCAFDSLSAGIADEGLSLEVLIERVAGHPILSIIFSELGVCHLDDGYARRKERRAKRERREDERLRRHQKWIDYVRSHEDALRSNRGAPHLLHQIAAAYFGALAEAEGSDPLARLGSVFRNDGRLIAAALGALRSTIRRDDLPDADEIIRLRDQRQQHYLALPLLAGLAESERVAPDEPLRLDDRQVRTALAFRYCGVSSDESAWYRRVLVSHTPLVAEMLIRTARSEIRNRRSHIAGVYELAHSEDHAVVARMVSLPLLRAFPTRCAARQLTDLRYLLWAALRHADRDSFANLIDQKLSRASMDIAQRACWLTAGLIVSPVTWLRPLEEFAERRERRVRHVAAFLDYTYHVLFPIDLLGTQSLQLLISLIGRYFGPCSPSGLVTLEVEASERMQWMISRLAESPCDEASTALEALVSDPALSRWQAELIRSMDDQRVVRRDATYRHPDIEQICLTLDDGPPANPADLAALVTDRLAELGDRIRNGNTDDWRQYWNENEYGRPCKPKHEDSCRDALLSDLRQCLPDELDAQPEGQYANDRRADIRISCRDFQIPVEIKKNSHPKLWSALRDQLIARYIRDPATDGYGIYLMLWFGELDGQRTPPPPTGVRPKGPDALKARLEEALTPEEARKISVCVIDVSAPAADVQ